MEKGLSFLEFNYMIMQSYDFYYMFQHYGCNMQFGGDDQWSNMLGGTELIRRKLGKDAYAMTITLLTRLSGQEDGQDRRQRRLARPQQDQPLTSSISTGATSDDSDVHEVHPYADLPAAGGDRRRWSTWEGRSSLNEAKEILAFELTALVHGKEEAEKAQTAAKEIFVSGGAAANMPTTTLTDADFTDGQIGVLTLLVKCGLASSNGEARKLVQGGGVSLNGEKVADFKQQLAKDFFNEECMIKKGKKTFHKAILG